MGNLESRAVALVVDRCASLCFSPCLFSFCEKWLVKHEGLFGCFVGRIFEFDPDPEL